ncbi:MAG TPA: DUF2062 domain-containing protein [Candidatus Acidoferrales bacterium]|jgi:uncharacterized protein (DUF2062 family)|nr:DUF2062 domain-containing protein [Candidatus Acidoferrales bacterium]
MPDITHPSRLKRFWRERVVALIVAQFTQGVTVQKMALTIALGMTLALFPILGSTTVLCAITAVWLRLNQPIIQAVNYLMYPLQIILIVVFVRIGEWIMRAQPVSFSIPVMLRKFHESPVKFMHEFGMTGLHAIIAWLLIAPVLAVVLYWVLLPPLKKLAQMTAKKS